MFPFPLLLCRLPHEHGSSRRNSCFRFMRGCRRCFLMLANQQREYGGQQHEDQRLHQTHQQLQKVKRNRQQPTEAREPASTWLPTCSRRQICCRRDESSARPAGTESRRFPGNRRRRTPPPSALSTSPVVSPLGANNSFRNPTRSNLLQRPDDPAGKEDERHGQRQIQIGIRAAEQRLIDLETIGRSDVPTRSCRPRE